MSGTAASTHPRNPARLDGPRNFHRLFHDHEPLIPGRGKQPGDLAITSICRIVLVRNGDELRKAIQDFLPELGRRVANTPTINFPYPHLTDHHPVSQIPRKPVSTFNLNDLQRVGKGKAMAKDVAASIDIMVHLPKGGCPDIDNRCEIGAEKRVFSSWRRLCRSRHCCVRSLFVRGRVSGQL